MIDIFDYADYRKFLADWFQSLKDENPRLSHRWFARKLGTTDPSALNNVITGRRSLGADRVEAVIEIVGLEGDAAEYFRRLIAFDQAPDADERGKALAQLRALRGAVRPALDDERIEVTSAVRYLAVRELARCGRGLPVSLEGVGERFQPPLPPEVLRDAVDRLLRLDLLREVRGHYVPRDPDVQTSVTVPMLASYAYHRECDALAQGALDQMPRNERQTSFTGHTLSLPASRLGELRRLLWEAFHEVAQRTDGWEDPDCVVQVNVRMFPLTQIDP